MTRNRSPTRTERLPSPATISPRAPSRRPAATMADPAASRRAGSSDHHRHRIRRRDAKRRGPRGTISPRPGGGCRCPITTSRADPVAAGVARSSSGSSSSPSASIYLLGSFGIIRVAWGVIWPVLLIGVGGLILYSALRPTRRRPSTAAVARDASARLELDLSVGAGRFRLEGGATPANLVEVASTNEDIASRIDRKDDRAMVRLRQDVAWWPDAWRSVSDWSVRHRERRPDVPDDERRRRRLPDRPVGRHPRRCADPGRRRPGPARHAAAARADRDPGQRGSDPAPVQRAARRRVPGRDERRPDVGRRPDRSRRVMRRRTTGCSSGSAAGPRRSRSARRPPQAAGTSEPSAARPPGRSPASASRATSYASAWRPLEARPSAHIRRTSRRRGAGA